MKKRTLISLAILVVVIAVAWRWMALPGGPAPGVPTARPIVAESAAASPRPLPPPAPAAPAPAGAQERLQEAAQQLAEAANADAARRILAELRAYLVALPRGITTAAMQQFLEAKTDAVTRLDFKISPGGSLADAPSLRVFLLDQLGQIDRAAAADYARTILAGFGSPDEWAVSLRDYALAHDTPVDAAFLQTKMRELLGHAAWQQNPSAGYLEAFDTIVHVKGTELAPDLAHLVDNKENRAVAHAAYLTLDRLVIQNPQAVLSQLAADPELMRGREQTRANYFARADVRDAEQRTLLEKYLLDPRRPPEELQTFAGLYPNANFMISNNLLTRTDTPTNAELADHDRAALGVIDLWLADPRFDRLKPQLQQINSRLRSFVEAASPAAP